MIRQLMTKKDIETYGFHYEPNESKCTTVQLRVVPSDFDNKNFLVRKIYFQNINSVFCSNGNAYVKGHGSIVSI